MASAYQEYHVQLINKRTGSPIDDDTGVCNVLTVDTPTEATIYSDDQGTTASNPLTITDGEISFFTASGTQTVDITGLTASGHPFFIDALTPSQHRLEIDTEMYSGMQLVIPWTISASAVSATDTGFDLNAAHIVKEVRVKVTTAGGTSNILNIGNSGSVSAFFQAVMSATGLKQAEWRETTGAPVAATVTLTLAGWYGVSMIASSTSLNGLNPYFGGAATAITYTEANQTGATGSGYIYMILDKVVV